MHLYLPWYIIHPCIYTLNTLTYYILHATLFREVRYGVEVGVSTVRIDPFPTRSFTLALGDVYVAYSERSVLIALPGVNDIDIGIEAQTTSPGTETPTQSRLLKKRTIITGLAPSAEYHVEKVCAGSGSGYRMASHTRGASYSARMSSSADVVWQDELVTDGQGELQFAAVYEDGCYLTADMKHD
jgi:hypothetical protein